MQRLRWVRLLLILPLLLTAIPLNALAAQKASTRSFTLVLVADGAISGTVTGTGAAPLSGVPVDVYNATGSFVTSISTNANGVYTAAGLSAGTYFARTFNSLGYIDQVYSGVSCASGCTVTTGTPITVTAGATTPNISFALVEGGRISGAVTGTGGTPLSGVTIVVHDFSGRFVTSTITNASGVYTAKGLQAGSYVVRTFNNLGYTDEAYVNISCAGGCQVTLGTLVPVTLGATTPNINFSLIVGGGISGTVTGTGGTPLSSVTVNVYNTSGSLITSTSTNSSGVYTATGLTSKSYLARTFNNQGYVDQLYNGISCASECTVTDGTNIGVSINSITPNINFSLVAGGSISGTVTGPGNMMLAGVAVNMYDTSGSLVTSASTNASGVYMTSGLPAGSYFVRTVNSQGYVDQLYNGISCAAGCTVTAGTPIAVTLGTTTSSIDFVLAAGGSISGTVTGPSSSLLQGIPVDIYDTSGSFVTRTSTNTSGAFMSAGLTPGTYFARTVNNQGYVDQLYSGISCSSTCTVTTGTPIAVPLGATSGVHFALVVSPVPSGGISGTVTGPGGVPLPGVTVNIYHALGTFLTSADTNASGVYTVTGLPRDVYTAKTVNNLGYVDQLYNGISCAPISNCLIKNGDGFSVTFEVTPNINFALVEGGSISGTITGAGGAPLPGVTLNLYSSNGSLLTNTSTTTNASGVYKTTGLTTGTYFIRTVNSQGYVDQLYSGIACGSVCTVTAGTPVSVTFGVATTNINFPLAAGGAVSGTVKSPSGTLLPDVEVDIYGTSGNLVTSANTNASGAYTTPILPAGTYFARTFSSKGSIDQLYNGIQCAYGCTVTAGTPIIITLGVAVPNVNFVFAPILTSITPFSGGRGAIVSVTLTGTNFVPGMTINAGTGIAVSNVAVLSPALAKATFSISPTATLGVQDVSLVVPGGIGNPLQFTVGQPTLTVIKSGSGSGTVTSSPAGINCGATCSTSFTSGQVFALTATPAAGSIFGGWSGDADCLDGSVTMTTFRNCVARFDLPQSNSTTLRGDFDGDGKTDIAIYRPSTGEWYIRLSTQGYATGAGNWYFVWGIPGDIPIVADFDGDRKTDIATYRPSTGEWSIRLSTQGYAIGAGNWYFVWGIPGDIPITGDFDGDRRTDIAVYRPTTGEWLIRLSTQNYAVGAGSWSFQWGLVGDVPVVGDFDGDLKADIGVYRPSTGEWYLRLSTFGYAVAAGNWYFQWGINGDQPLTGDFDGDGKTDISVYRPSTGEWLLRLSTFGYLVAAGNWYFQWGINDDRPIVSDFDGDGKSDITIYRPSTGEWLLRQSTLGYTFGTGNCYFQWGINGDLPFPRQ